jgi:hypothetical protein
LRIDLPQSVLARWQKEWVHAWDNIVLEIKWALCILRCWCCHLHCEEVVVIWLSDGHLSAAQPSCVQEPPFCVCSPWCMP